MLNTQIPEKLNIFCLYSGFWRWGRNKGRIYWFRVIVLFKTTWKCYWSFFFVFVDQTYHQFGAKGSGTWLNQNFRGCDFHFGFCIFWFKLSSWKRSKNHLRCNCPNRIYNEHPPQKTFGDRKCLFFINPLRAWGHDCGFPVECVRPQLWLLLRP